MDLTQLWQMYATNTLLMVINDVAVALIVIGLFIALPDPFTKTVTSRDNFGWLLVGAGVATLVVLFIIPFWPVLWAAIVVVWTGSTWWMLAGFIGGIIAIVIGIAVTRRH